MLQKVQLVFVDHPTNWKFKNLTNQKFNDLRVLGFAGDRHWYCECDCGNICKVFSSDLKSNKAKTCGCLKIRFEAEKSKRCEREYIEKFYKKFPDCGVTIKSMDSKRVLVSNKYGDCSVSRAGLMTGRMPTILTAINKTEYFINQAIAVHGDKYNYNLVEYINMNTKIKIICKNHGIFEQTPDKHLQKRGCHKCGREISGGYTQEDFIRFAKNKPATLYFIRCWNKDEEFYKIGITTRTLKERFSKGNTFPYDYEIITQFHGDAKLVYKLENKFHKEYKLMKYSPGFKFDGYTECFTKI